MGFYEVIRGMPFSSYVVKNSGIKKIPTMIFLYPIFLLAL